MRQVQAKVGVLLSAPDLLANIEGAIRAAMYMASRHRYNDARTADRWDEYRSADFLFLREYAYAAMFRFNSSDEFNVPYGGVTLQPQAPHRPRSTSSSVTRMIERLSATEWRSMDFEPFISRSGRRRLSKIRLHRPAL